jgi:hypothetical protein
MGEVSVALSKCVVCRVRPCAGLLFCVPCQRSYDRAMTKDATLAGLLRWCAERTRRLSTKPPGRSQES